MRHLGLQPEETVSILEELARLAETRRWKNTSGQLKSHRLVCTQKNNEASCGYMQKIPFIIQPLNVTRQSLIRTLKQNGLKKYKANNWEGYLWIFIYYTA